MRRVLILGIIIAAATAQADHQSRCESEAQHLKDSVSHDSFVKDCVDSGSWSTTLDSEAISWEKCKLANKISSYHECLNNNRIYKESMIPSFNCYYKDLGVLSSKGYNKYRYAKTDALYYNCSETKLYEVYTKCLEGKARPEDLKESVKFYECLAKEIHEEASSLILKDWKESPSYIEDFRECKKAINKDLITSSFLSTPFQNDEYLPYVKCVFGRMGFLENSCFYVDRLMNAFKDNEENNKNLYSCFKESCGENEFDFVSLWNCLVQNKVFNKYDS